MEEMIYIIVSAIIAGLVVIFGKKRQQEKAVNRAKVPQAVLRWEPQITAASKEFGVPVHLSMSVLWTESAGNPDARGSAGEKGLMQLKEIAVRDLQLQGFGRFPGWERNPNENIRAGVAYLRRWYDVTGNWYEAIKAYNQGLKGSRENPELANDYLNKIRNKEPFFA